MTAADEHIYVTDAVKHELDRLRREGEGYNEVLEGLLAVQERDLLAVTAKLAGDIET